MNIESNENVIYILEFIDEQICIEKELKEVTVPTIEFETNNKKLPWLNELGVIKLYLI